MFSSEPFPAVFAGRLRGIRFMRIGLDITIDAVDFPHRHFSAILMQTIARAGGDLNGRVRESMNFHI